MKTKEQGSLVLQILAWGYEQDVQIDGKNVTEEEYKEAIEELERRSK